MARTTEQQRQVLEEEQRKLAERWERHAERVREEAIKAMDRTGLLKLEGARLEGLAERIRKLGIEEVEKRLAA